VLVRRRHADVGQQHLGPLFVHGGQRRFRVLTHREHLDPRLGAEEVHEALADEESVVCDHHARHERPYLDDDSKPDLGGYGAAGVWSRLPRHHQAMPPTRSANARAAKATQPQSVLSGSSVAVAAAAPAAAAAPGLPVVVVTVLVTVTAAGAGWVVVAVEM